MPKSPMPASLSGEESVEVATPTPSWVPQGKERAVGGGMGDESFVSWYEMGVPCVGGLLGGKGVDVGGR